MLSHLIQHRTKHLDEPLDSTGEKEQPVIWFQSIESNHFAFELNDISPTIIGDIRRGRQLATECCAQSTQFFSKTQGQAQKIKTYRKTLSHHVKLKEQNKRVFTANALLRYFFSREHPVTFNVYSAKERRSGCLLKADFSSVVCTE